MPVQRTAISRSQLAELVGLDHECFVAIERRVDGWYLVTEGTDMQTSGTLPQLADNASRKKPRKGRKK